MSYVIFPSRSLEELWWPCWYRDVSKPPPHGGCCQLCEGCTGSASTQQLHLTTVEREDEEPALCSVGCENYSITINARIEKQKQKNLAKHTPTRLHSASLVHNNIHSNKESVACELVFLDNRQIWWETSRHFVWSYCSTYDSLYIYKKISIYSIFQSVQVNQLKVVHLCCIVKDINMCKMWSEFCELENVRIWCLSINLWLSKKTLPEEKKRGFHTKRLKLWYSLDLSNSDCRRLITL